jgi:drug/metabolite transporter (DMT)-like permease
MIYVILAISFFFLQNVSNKEFTRRFKSALPGLALFDGLALSVASVALMLTGGLSPLPGPQLLLAAGFAVLFVITVFLIVLTMASGPMGMSALLINMSMVIPTTMGLLIWHESLSLVKGLGILCMTAVLIISGLSEKGKGKSANLKWFLLALVTMVCNGSLSVLQKVLTSSFENPSIVSFNCVSFGIGALLCWALALIFKLRGQDLSPWTSNKKTLALCAAGMGLGTVGGNLFNTLALTVLPASVSFPLVQGTVIVVLLVGSAFLYKERLNKAGYLSVALGLAGIVLLSLA